MDVVFFFFFLGQSRILKVKRGIINFHLKDCFIVTICLADFTQIERLSLLLIFLLNIFKLEDFESFP